MPQVIDYNALRVALVASVRAACDLGQNSVVMAEPEHPIANRPQAPFASIKITTAAQKFGRDSITYAALPGDDVGCFTYSGQRALTCAFDFFGSSHEEAYGLAAAYQSALDRDDIFQALEAAGLAVWRVDQVVDLSLLLSTGYEGRAHLTAQFGVLAKTTVDVGFIAHVPVEAAIGDEAVTFTADLPGD